MHNLYPIDVESDFDRYEEVISNMMSRIDKLDRSLQKEKEKRKDCKKGLKDLTRRLVTIEEENDQLKQCVQIILRQPQSGTSAWWKDAAIKAAPNLIDLASTCISRK